MEKKGRVAGQWHRPSPFLLSMVPRFVFSLLWWLWGIPLGKTPEHSMRPILAGRGPSP